MPSFRSRPSRGMSVFTILVGIGMLVFALSMAGKSDLGRGPGGAFLALWVLVVIGIIAYHAYNAATGKGYTESIDVDDSTSLPDLGGDSSESVASRLQELDSLKEEGLISEEEYDKERQRILGSI